MTALAFDGVAFAYPGRPVFRDFSLAIERGEFTFLLGPNGCGKTTLVRLATRTAAPSAGRVLLGDADVARLGPREIARRVAVVPQEEAGVFRFSVEEAVLMGRTAFLDRFGFEGEDDRRIARESLEQVEAAHLLDRALDELSGGERQRVLLARALAQRTDLLLLDEPTSHLDLRHQAGLLALLARLHEEAAPTVVVITHDVNLAARFGRRLVLVADGEVAAAGPPEEVLRPEILSEVYRTKIAVRRVEGVRAPYVFPE